MDAEDPPPKKPRRGAEFHAATQGDTLLLSECVKEGEDAAIHGMTRLRQGEQITKDTPLYRAVPGSRKGHVKLKEIKLGKGPLMVTTKAYRAGWENVFGDRQVN